jgi:hypothetical protein
MPQAQHPWSSAEVALVEAGKLVLPTGSIVACDPLVSLGNHRPFARSVAPGTYRVVIALHGGDVVYASVVLGEGVPRRWVPAVFAGQSELEGTEGVPGYGVDSGTGCFVDSATAAAWKAATDAWRSEQARRVAASGVDANDAAAWHAAMRALDAERPDLNLLARLETVGSPGELELEGGTLVAFTSGAGDGVYASYWGLDEGGDAIALLTDFGLLDRKAADEEERPEPGELDRARLATALLDRLLRDELVVLKRVGKRKALEEALAGMLAEIEEDDDARGATLAEWFTLRPDVDEVFASDDDLDRALAETLRAVS